MLIDYLIFKEVFPFSVIVPAFCMIVIPLFIGMITALFSNVDGVDLQNLGDEEVVLRKAWEMTKEEFKKNYGGVENGNSNKKD